MYKTFLPDSITLPCGTVLNKKIHYISGLGVSRAEWQRRIKAKGGKYRVVRVLSRNLRRALDLHHKPYRPSTWILTNIDRADLETPS